MNGILASESISVLAFICNFAFEYSSYVAITCLNIKPFVNVEPDSREHYSSSSLLLLLLLLV